MDQHDKYPLVFPFKSLRMKYIYDTNTNCIVCISNELYEALSSKLSVEQILSNNETRDEFEKLRENGFLSNNRVQKIEHPKSQHMSHVINYQLNLITLQVTQRCNLRCAYCAYSGIYENRDHGNFDMTFETAKKAIDFMIDRSVDSNRLSVSFYGGEPLLKFDLIRQCVEYVEKEIHGRPVDFIMTTNGTLLTDDVLQFLDEHRFLLTISLDGDQESHDKNRRFAHNDKGSFEVIMRNVEKIKDHYPTLSGRFNFNVVMDTSNTFGQINDFYTGFNAIQDMTNLRATYISPMNAKESIVYHTNFIAAREYEIFKMFLSRMGRYDISKVSLLVRDIYSQLYSKMYLDRDSGKSLPAVAHPGGPCTGVQRLFVDVHGNFFPCERINEKSKLVNLGNLDDGLNLTRLIDNLNIGRISEEECKNCWNFRFCGACVNFADGEDKLSKKKKLGYCKSLMGTTHDSFLDYCLLFEMGCDVTADRGVNEGVFRLTLITGK